MRLLLPAVLALGSLAGCQKAYLLDQTVPTKTALLTPELARHGLEPSKSQCVAGALASKLSVWQLRELTAALAAQRDSGGAAGVGEAQLWQIVPQIALPKVRSRVTGAFETCGVSRVASAPAAAPAASAATVEGTAEAAPGKIQNGPANYEPSANLLKALDAYERRDFAGAARLAKAAADSGDSGAQQFLGGLYASGQGVPVDHAAAARYYRLAAEQGWSEAMNNLGKALEAGAGVAADPVEALKWYLLASARATEDEQLVARNVQNLLNGLQPAAVEKARAMAREWEESRRRQ
ncbi:MAG TPA: tetratricopeptide repeat protein [Allosphingosinicella sp.]|nr:tetratricopeptide repeat protein [Allosphingosinicella sp.]